MKKITIIYIAVIASILSIQNIFAAGMTSTGFITELYVNNAWAMVKLENVSTNPDGCNVGYYALTAPYIDAQGVQQPGDSNYSSLYSVLVTAQVTGKRVKFYVDGCAGQGSMYPHIRSVIMLEN